MRTQLGLMVLSLALAAGCSAAPAPVQAPEVPVEGCSAPFPVVDANRAVVVEGFGGPDAQLFVTKRQPHQRCAASVVQAREARLSALP